MMLLMNATRQEREDHNIKAQVPEFQACKCHGKGIKATTNPRKDIIEKNGYVGSFELGIVESRVAKVDETKKTDWGERSEKNKIALTHRLCVRFLFQKT